MLLARIEGAPLSKAYKLRFQVSVFRFQNFATRPLPALRSLEGGGGTPGTRREI